jgi:hypothetical protein
MTGRSGRAGRGDPPRRLTGSAEADLNATSASSGDSDPGPRHACNRARLPLSSAPNPW